MKWLFIFLFFLSTNSLCNNRLSSDLTIATTDYPSMLLKLSGLNKKSGLSAFASGNISKVGINGALQIGILKGKNQFYIGNLFGSDDILAAIPKRSLNNILLSNEKTARLPYVKNDFSDPLQITLAHTFNDNLIFSSTFIPIPTLKKNSTEINSTVISGVKYKNIEGNLLYNISAICEVNGIFDHYSYEFGTNLSYIGINVGICVGKLSANETPYLVTSIGYEIGPFSLEFSNFISSEFRSSISSSYKIQKNLSMYATIMYLNSVNNEKTMLLLGLKKDFSI